jgi:hypothetical protein
LDATISTDTNWDDLSRPYVISGGMKIAAGSTLTLAAGVEVQVRPDLAGGTDWTLRDIEVRGTLRAEGAVGQRVTIHGAYPEHPGTGIYQFGGIETYGAGVVDLTQVFISEAEKGVVVRPVAPSSFDHVLFTGCQTAVLVAAGTATTFQGCDFRDNGIGLQLNNAGASLVGCTFLRSSQSAIETVAMTDDASLFVEASSFQSSGASHLRLNFEFGRLLDARVRGSNIIPAEGTIPFDLVKTSCFGYRLQLRGNYWGQVSGPADILALFPGQRICDSGIDTWSETCDQPDPADCDWSPTPFSIGVGR